MKAPEIFVADYPVLGKVPLIFYLPLSPDNPEREEMVSLIEKYGGRVTNVHECHTYQIAPL